MKIDTRAPGRRLRLALAAAAVALVAAPAAQARPTGPLVPATGALLGAYTAATTVPATATNDALRSSLAWTEQKAGRKLDLYSYYYAWRGSFPSWRETDLGTAQGRLSMISWGGTDVRTINSGSQDAVIDARADAVKAFGKPIFIRWFWEMDGAARVSTSRTPAEWIAAWKRIVDRFRARGATNAVWVWCPNAWAFEIDNGAQWYPGNAYVDWVCADGYNWAPVKPKAPWQTFTQIFQKWYTWAVTTNKPLMIGETAAQERLAGEKAAWMDDLRVAVKAMPNIAAVIWFDTYDDRGYDWRLRTSTTAAAAWGRIGLDPYFRTRG